MPSNMTRTNTEILKDIRLQLAPMEGCTGYVYRNALDQHFPGADQYFTPFLSANHNFKFKKKEMHEVDPAYNKCKNVVPQIITNNAEQFVWACQEMAELGYDHVNLNAGCPSSTVVAKRKGAGMLMDPCDFEDFLDDTFEEIARKQIPVKISIKTRMGVNGPDEMEYLTELYNRYPLEELIIHARYRKDFYKEDVDFGTFKIACQDSLVPVSYNGDIYQVEDAVKVVEDEPKIVALMCGRGVMKNPALLRQMRGGAGLTRQELVDFMGQLWQDYCIEVDGPGNALFRMKEIWAYTSQMFEDIDKPLKTIRKTRKASEYEAAAREIMMNHKMLV